MNILNNNRGFTLAEVLISLLIFSIACLALFFALSVSLKIKGNNENQLFASKFAEEKMIFIKNDKKAYAGRIKYDTIPSLREKLIEEKIEWQLTDKQKLTFTRSTELKIESASPLLLHVWITVLWKEKDREKKFLLESYL